MSRSLILRLLSEVELLAHMWDGGIIRKGSHPQRLPSIPEGLLSTYSSSSPCLSLVPPRGLEAPPRGWSVSLHSGDAWRDLPGCDFVLDLIGQTEDLGDPAGPHNYPIALLGLYVPPICPVPRW